MKEKTRIGVWNVRTLCGSGKIYQAASELRRFKLDVMGISMLESLCENIRLEVASLKEENQKLKINK